MNSREAKFILQAYRPGGEDANNPQFAEALEQVKRDPELTRWFAEQVAFDAAATRALKEVKIPAHLRETILVGNRVAKSVLWWKRPGWWAMAASFLVLASIAGFWFQRQRSSGFANYLAEISRAAQITPDHLDIKTKDPEKIRTWLTEHHAETNFILPDALRGEPAMGCRVLAWHGHIISMLCYMLEGSKHVDLFVAQNSGFSNPPADGELRIGHEGSLTTASWTRAGKTYVLIGSEDEQFLRKYVRLNGPAVARIRARPGAS